ncbi:fimbrial protein [[Enterobacter] lignolyticus]|uniref:Fimbrial protein domain-containing protein n=1 Tax=Enterobacter lignolyticus (strain SCF1) TaxID=701347 RepID=E3G301_ENTLS|nr:fimbrial protein [[Enterobacter] lignolyticus]ADO49268.1 Fimbrial protein domain-containing protein [[Enterobacter] lignolyticus SCF1]
MKKIVIGALIASSLCGSVSVFAATNGEGQVNFTGEILDSACEVVNNLSNPLNVNLGKVSKTAFSGIGSTADTTQFAIQLKNCPETVSTAAITFGGTPDTDNNNVLALTAGTGVAAGVGIQLLDSSQQPLSLYTASQPYTLQSGTATNNLEFAARYIQTQSTISAGPANAVSTFTVVYN